MGKRVTSTTVIGGADGPTSIFLVGKMGKGSISQRVRRYFYRKKKNRIAKTIIADPHTLDETISYIREKYHAADVVQQSFNYQEQRRCLKESLILQHRPELLGEWAKLEAPEEPDENSLKEFWMLLEQRSKEAGNIGEEDFPMDFHLYEIDFSGKGKVEVMVENNWEQFGVSYSSYGGDKSLVRQMREMEREIYLYYGVTKKDIELQSERYKSLLAALCG